MPALRMLVSWLLTNELSDPPATSYAEYPPQAGCPAGSALMKASVACLTPFCAAVAKSYPLGPGQLATGAVPVLVIL